MDKRMQHIGIFLIFAASVKSAGVYTSVLPVQRQPHAEEYILSHCKC